LSKTDITTEAEALGLATRIASSHGLELLPVGGREHGRYGNLTRMRMRGRLSGVAVEYELRFLDAGPVSELSAFVDVKLTRKWVDMQVVGRSMPGLPMAIGPYSADLAAEFSLRTDDDEYLSALLRGDVEKVLISANYAGYQPRLDHQSLSLGAVALDPAGTEKLLRHAARLGALLEGRLSEIPGPKRERELLAVLEPLEKGMDGRLDRHGMQLEIRRIDGTLVLGIVHHAYDEWSTAIELLFEQPLPVKMSIAPVRAFYENWFRPDIETDDGKFDRAFTVRGEPEDRVIALLGERSRRALEAVVRRANDVLVTQDGINLQLPGVILDAGRQREMLDSVFDLAEALTTHASGPQAYR
jgi:hypothetical protein